MIILQATKLWQEYHSLHSKKNTIKTYNQTLTKFTWFPINPSKMIFEMEKSGK